MATNQFQFNANILVFKKTEVCLFVYWSFCRNNSTYQYTPIYFNLLRIASSYPKWFDSVLILNGTPFILAFSISQLWYTIHTLYIPTESCFRNIIKSCRPHLYNTNVFWPEVQKDDMWMADVILLLREKNDITQQHLQISIVKLQFFFK